MAGSTGKMTREAIAARGPRLLLIQEKQTLVWHITLETKTHSLPPGRYFIYARSYSRSYLERVKKGQSHLGD